MDKNAPITDITTTILINIRDEISGVRSELKDTNKRLDDTNKRIDNLREETKIGLKQVHDSLSTRLDKVIENTGSHYRNLDSRVTAIEQHLRLS